MIEPCFLKRRRGFLLIGSACGPAVFRSRSSSDSKFDCRVLTTGSTPLRIEVVCGDHACLKRTASPPHIDSNIKRKL
jgi:hypothetical protein